MFPIPQSHAALLGMDDAKFGFIGVKYLEQIKGPLKRCQSLKNVEFYLILEVDFMGVPLSIVSEVNAAQKLRRKDETARS